MQTKRNVTIFPDLLLALTLTTNLHAITGCTNAYLQGSYGGQISGVVAGVKPSSPSGGSSIGPALTLNRLVFDGQGSVYGTEAANGNGNLTQWQVAGSYAVNTDCTVVMALTDTAGSQQNFNGVLVSGGDRAYLARVDVGFALSGALERARNSCTAADFSGTYGFRRSGATLSASAVAPAAASVPSVDSVGLINADGNGSFSMTESLAGSGASGWSASTGTYTVGDDCSVTLTFDATAAAGAASVQGTLTNNRGALFSIETRSSIPVAGSFSVQ